MGTVETRADSSMILDISDERGPRQYLIVGKAIDGHFEGADGAGKRGDEVRARWASVGGDVFAGTWLEDGDQYLFSFDLSEQARALAKLQDTKYEDAMRRRLPGSYGTSRRR